MSRPNILCIITHDTGTHLGCYGHATVHSPALDRLAAAGVRFDRYYCTAPQCSPSRGSIITGRYPHVNGLMGLVNRGWNLPNDEATMPQLLRAAGYETRLFGFQHEKADARDLGCCYNWISARGERPDVAVIGPQAEAFLAERGAASASADAPFFAMVGFSETHRPFDGYDSPDPASVEVPPYLPDHPDVRLDLAQFHGAIAAMDAGVGRILDALADAGLADDTLVVYTTDHGIAFPRAKCNLYEAGIRTALLMRWPLGIVGRRVEMPLLSNVDLLPTLLEIADAPIPGNLDGCSFAALLRGEAYAERDAIFAEKTWHDKYDPMRGLRTERFKYIRSYDPQRLVDVPLDIHRGLSGQVVRDLWTEPRPDELLFDLESDPLEERNVADDPAFADTRQELSERLTEWMTETRDPLLAGHVPPPRPAVQLASWVDPPTPAAMEAVARSLAERTVAAMQAGDLDAWLEDYAEDAVLLMPGAVLRGHEALTQLWHNVVVPTLAGLTLRNESVTVDGNIVLATWCAADAEGVRRLEVVDTSLVGTDGRFHQQTGLVRPLT